MAKTNYSFEKRQRELAKKKKQEEKRARKATRADGSPEPAADSPAADAPGAPPAAPAERGGQS